MSLAAATLSSDDEPRLTRELINEEPFRLAHVAYDAAASSPDGLDWLTYGPGGAAYATFDPNYGPGGAAYATFEPNYGPGGAAYATFETNWPAKQAEAVMKIRFAASAGGEWYEAASELPAADDTPRQSRRDLLTSEEALRLGNVAYDAATSRMIRAAAAADFAGGEWYKAASELPAAKSAASAGPLIFMILVYGLASAIFVLRASLIGYASHFHMCKVLPAIGPVFVYLAVGVLLPILSRRVGQSQPMMTLLVHREHYSNLKGRSMQQFLCVSQRLAVPVHAFGLVAPALAALQIIMFWKQHLQVEDLSAPLHWSIVLLCGASVFTVCFVNSYIDELVLDSSHVALRGLMFEMQEASTRDQVGDHSFVQRGCCNALPSCMSTCTRDDFPQQDEEQGTCATLKTEDRLLGGVEDESVGREASMQEIKEDLSIDWDNMSKQHRALDIVLSDIWSMKHAGGLWMLRITLCCSCSFACTVRSITLTQWETCISWGLAGSICALSAVSLLLRLASVAKLASDTSPINKSVVSSVLAFVGRVPAHRLASYNSYLAYLQCRSMGVWIGGRLIDYALVIDMGKQFGLYIPAALHIIAGFLKAESRLAKHH